VRLHYAHGQGTLHRDIKPANLLLDANEHLWVTDFGLAKALEAEGLTHSGDLLGTLQYMAPEQFEGSYDVRSEVYALGVTLYEVLVLRAAFAGKTRSELMERIRTQRPEPLRRLCPEVPEDLVVVVEKAMAREPNDRYRDAHELEQDLQAFLEDRPIQARRHSAPALVLRWCRRNRAMAALAASTVLAVVGAGVYGWIAYGVTNEALVQTKKGRRGGVRAGDDRGAAIRASGEEPQNALLAFGKMFDALVGPDPALDARGGRRDRRPHGGRPAPWSTEKDRRVAQGDARVLRAVRGSRTPATRRCSSRPCAPTAASARSARVSAGPRTSRRPRTPTRRPSPACRA
jgi:hypothetical protein